MVAPRTESVQPAGAMNVAPSVVALGVSEESFSVRVASAAGGAASGEAAGGVVAGVTGAGAPSPQAARRANEMPTRGARMAAV